MVDIFPPRGMPGAQAENWARSAEDRIIEVEKEITRLDQFVRAGNRDASSQIEQLAAIIRAVPIQFSGNSRAAGFGISGAWASYASLSMTVPAGKRNVDVLAIGTGAVIDATSGGLTTSYGRCVIQGSIGGESPAAKDAGSSAVNNVITATHSTRISANPGESINIAFQMYGLNGSAYPARPSNYAQIAVVATFS